MSRNIHETAHRLSAQRGITQSEALSLLARRSAEVRRRKACALGILRPTQSDRAAFSHVESPRYWYLDKE